MDCRNYQVIRIKSVKLISSHYLIFYSIMHLDFHKILVNRNFNLMV
jgi:hypothetical protein